MTITKTKNCKISGFKLVLPTVCNGNVAQLTADLLIETLKMEKFAIIFHSAVIPIIGPAAFEGGDVTTASEMFISEKHKLLILQTRTPTTLSLLNNFLDEILQFFKDEKLSELVILTSSFAHEQHFIGKNPFKFKANDFVTSKQFVGFSETKEVSIPGGGYAQKLFQRASEREIPALMFFKSVSEGDNSLDGMQLCQKVDEAFLKAIPVKTPIQIPISWKYLFGRNVNSEIY